MSKLKLYKILGSTALFNILIATAGCGTPNPNTSSSSSSSSVSSVPPASSSSSSSQGVAHATCPSTDSAAFENFPRILPGRIEAEDFDKDGYSDSSDTNEGGSYRTDTAVDIKSISGGDAVGWMTGGEYLEYTVYVENEGDYDVTIRSGAVGTGRTIKVSQCNRTLVESFKVPNVADWGQFKTWSAGKIHLTPGTQKLRVEVSGADYMDLDWIHIGSYTGTIDPEDPAPVNNSGNYFVGNITTGGQVRSDFINYWNQITPENEGKWASVEGTRDQYNWSGVDRSYNYAKQHGIPFKQHTFVWGAQSPSWINNLSATETAAEIEEWIKDFCTRYPDVEMIDVVNEATPGHQPAAYAQKAYGNNWITRVFQIARQHCPNSILILNDYNVLSWNTSEFITMAKPAAQSGYVDAIGLQAHGLEDRSNSDLKSKLDRLWNELQLPMYVSEYDVARTNDQEQLQIFQRQFDLFYNYPHIDGITIWGYVVGRTWVNGSGLIQDNGNFRPAMTWLMDYLKANPK